MTSSIWQSQSTKTKMNDLHPIQTHYLGYVFRSRLEARWAVFFKNVKLNFRYEDEGYNLEGIPYLPDFYLDQLDCYVEIKGNKPTPKEINMAFLLAKHSQKIVHIFSGSIPLPDIRTWDKNGFSIYTFTGSVYNRGTPYSPFIYAINQCPVCKKVNFAMNARISALPCGCSKLPLSKPSRMVSRAYLLARSARFEFGEYTV